MDLDYILPFAGIPENGCEIDGLDDRSELAFLMTLVNLLRILGAIKDGVFRHEERTSEHRLVRLSRRGRRGELTVQSTCHSTSPTPASAASNDPYMQLPAPIFLIFLTTSHLSCFLLNAMASTSNGASNVSSPFIH